jgi:hypothetical protein
MSINLVLGLSPYLRYLINYYHQPFAKNIFVVYIKVTLQKAKDSSEINNGALLFQIIWKPHTHFKV